MNEGDPCPDCGNPLEYDHAGCTCNVTPKPPCGFCESHAAPVYCNGCGWTEDGGSSTKTLREREREIAGYGEW